MKSLAKISSAVMAIIAMGGCTCSSDNLFPSLFGSDTQEQTINEKDAAAAGIVLGTTNFKPVKVSDVSDTGTFVGQKVLTFRNELNQLQKSIKANNSQLQEIRSSVVNNALSYHKTVGMIEAKLQVGTTPGNPIMFEMLGNSQNNIRVMSTNSSALEQLSARVAADTANTDYLVEAIQSAYTISGAVDEDHRQLRVLENEAGQTSILMHSLLNEVSSDIVRQQKYIDTANDNIARLSDAIRVGSYGVSNVPMAMSRAGMTGGISQVANVALSNNGVGGKPLFAVKFNDKNVNYKDGLKQAVGSAVARKQNVAFDIVAVSPVSGESAQQYAAKVFQDIVNMGVSVDKVNIASRTDSKTKVPAVMVFVR